MRFTAFARRGSSGGGGQTSEQLVDAVAIEEVGDRTVAVGHRLSAHERPRARRR